MPFSFDTPAGNAAAKSESGCDSGRPPMKPFDEDLLHQFRGLEFMARKEGRCKECGAKAKLNKKGICWECQLEQVKTYQRLLKK